MNEPRTPFDPDRGYTLMEVLIALTILAGALTVLLGTQSNAVQRGSMANDMTTASLLARAKMLEVETLLNSEGFNQDQQVESGDFRKEGYGHYRWEAVIDPVEIDEGAQETLMAEVNGQLFGEGSDGTGGTFTGNAAFAAYLPMVVGLIPDFINRLGQRVRKVELVVSWDYRGHPQKLTLVQYVTDLDADERQETPEGIDAPEPDEDLP